MKSAIQELIERIEQQIELSAHNKLGTNRTGDYRIGLNAALSFAFDALEQEKKQILDAYLSAVGYNGNCESHQMRMLDKRFLEQAEQYYTQTYKTN